MKKKQLVIGVTTLGMIAIAGAIIFSNSKAFASDTGDTMVEKLAQKLGIEQSKVETAMDEIRTEDQNAREVERTTKLEQAVKDGVITEDQKTKLIEKQKAMQSESKETMKQNHDVLDQWMKDNGIDTEKIRDYLGGPRDGRGMGEGRRRHGDGIPSDTTI